MNLMYLYLLFQDGRIEKHVVKRFSNLSQTKSKFYYYEEFHHSHGKGVCVLRDDIVCFEIAPFPVQTCEYLIDKKAPR